MPRHWGSLKVPCCCWVAQSCPTLCDPMDCSMPGLPVPHHLPESMMPSKHLILWCFLLLLPSIFPSIRDFSKESSIHIRWPKYCSFSFSISPSNEYSGLISLKIDCFDLLVVQTTFRSLLQHHSLKSSILWHSAFFMAQLSQLYMTTGNIIDRELCRQGLCFSTCCLGLSSLSCQEAIFFWFHVCSHCPQWSWSPRRGNLSLFPPFPLLFAMQ